MQLISLTNGPMRITVDTKGPVVDLSGTNGKLEPFYKMYSVTGTGTATFTLETSMYNSPDPDQVDDWEIMSATTVNINGAGKVDGTVSLTSGLKRYVRVAATMGGFDDITFEATAVAW